MSSETKTRTCIDCLEEKLMTKDNFTINRRHSNGKINFRLIA